MAEGSKEKRMSVIELKAAEIPTEKVDYQPVPEELPGKAGKIVESLSVDQLALLATGDPGRAQATRLAPQEFLFREQQRRHPRVLRRSRGM